MIDPSVPKSAGALSSCGMCSTIARPHSPWDEPLFVSDNFVAVPSLGSLVEGWLLIMPKTHFICSGALDSDLALELSAFKREIWKRLEAVYGKVAAFEHGPCAPGRQAGCGVDHAHIHLLPLSLNLSEAVLDVQWTRGSWLDCTGAYARDLDYLFIEQPFGVGHIAMSAQFGGQILRKAIATRLGKPNEFDWREFPQVQIIENTIATLALSTSSA